MIIGDADVNVKDKIAPSFYKLFWDIWDGLHTHYWLKGGRGSTKSSFVSIMIILGMMTDPLANAVIFKKVEKSLRESVFEQLIWAINELGVNKLWKVSYSPLRLTYKPTGQAIIFRGCETPRMMKSTKLAKGYFKYLWYEEVDEQNCMEDIRTINQTFMRGGAKYCVFYTYNPPKSVKSWVNMEVATPKDNRCIHHSSYLDVPEDWLGEVFLIEAKHLKKVNEDAYNHEYLGQVTGTGGEIFMNVKIDVLLNSTINSFDKIKHGLDWGYAVDPFCYVKCYYDSTRRKLYIFDEIYKVGLSNRLAAQQVKAKNPLNEMVICDSAEPKSIDEIRGYGIRARGAVKGPGSINHGIKWLSDLEQIIIDPNRCPNAAREFMNYELEKDRNGGFKSKYPDADNHSIDAVRYALEDEIRGENFSFN